LLRVDHVRRTALSAFYGLHFHLRWRVCKECISSHRSVSGRAFRDQVFGAGSPYIFFLFLSYQPAALYAHKVLTWVKDLEECMLLKMPAPVRTNKTKRKCNVGKFFPTRMGNCFLRGSNWDTCVQWSSLFLRWGRGIFTWKSPNLLRNLV